MVSKGEVNMEISELEGKIINADCMDILKQLPDKSIDLVVTSPPYDNLRNYNNTLDWSFDIFQKIAKELARTLKDGGVIVWVVADATIDESETGTSFKQALYFKEIGLNLHDTMIWNKGSFTFPSISRYHNIFEYMFVFSKGTPKSFHPIKDRKNLYLGKRGASGRDKNGQRNEGFSQVLEPLGQRFNIWNIPVGGNHSYKFAINHPAVFPLELAQDHIISWSNENDLILDCFSGSGTTAIACHRLKRRFICIEKDPDYWAKSCERLKAEQAQLQLF